MDYEFSGEIITRESEQYEQSRLIWNRCIDSHPYGIIYCSNTYDVCMAINYVRNMNGKCRICTGGHSDLGFCTGDDVFVINLSRVNQCDYNKDYHMVSCGCGVINQTVCKYLLDQNCFFPGPDPNTYIGVWSMCGGIGCASRTYGLGCDYLAHIELVNYQGEVICANQSQNQDLFWAIKGAGAGNFGVVTNLVYYLPPPVEKVCFFELSISYCTRSSIIEFIEVWQDWLSVLEPQINCQVQFCNTFHQGRYIFGYGVSYLSVEETKVKLGPFASVKGLRISYESKQYYNAISSLNRFYEPYVRQSHMGRFVYDHYEVKDIEYMADMIWGRRAEGGIYSSLTLTSMGGFISKYNNQASSFYYRDASYLLSLRTQWFDEDCHSGNELWMLRKYDYLKSITRGAYIHQPFSGYQDYEHEYFGENAYWLKQVKAKYDPYNFFSFPQGIRI